MKNEGELTWRLKRTAIIVGTLLLLISVYMSFDGFDGKVGGGERHAWLAVGIGLTLAAAVNILQFILASAPEKLNWTLRIVGYLSYAYSVYTNQLGARNILKADEGMAWVIAVFVDVVSEPLIAWGLGESLVGDLLGNLGKAVYGKKTDSNYNRQPPVQASFRSEINRSSPNRFKSLGSKPSEKRNDKYFGN